MQNLRFGSLRQWTVVDKASERDAEPLPLDLPERGDGDRIHMTTLALAVVLEGPKQAVDMRQPLEHRPERRNAGDVLEQDRDETDPPLEDDVVPFDVVDATGTLPWLQRAVRRQHELVLECQAGTKLGDETIEAGLRPVDVDDHETFEQREQQFAQPVMVAVVRRQHGIDVDQGRLRCR
jgi:hypothetical protein